MASFRVDTTPVRNRLNLLAGQIRENVAVALNEIAEETMLDAKRRTPVDTGVLRDTGKVSRHATPRALRAELSYGTDYAVYVHERLNVRHKHGEPKFLERAVNETARTMAARLAEKLAALRAGG